MSDQSKPTGEWTAEYVQHGLDIGGPALIAAAHNAAIAAANETEAIKVVWRRVVTLEQQLAAAWEALVTVRELREHDQKALAAEREKVKNLQRQLDDFGYSMRTNE